MRGTVTGATGSRSSGRRTRVLFALLVVFAVAVNAMFAERNTLNDGLGFGDGQLYAHIAQDPVGATVGRKSDSYAVQRVLPPVIIGLLLRAARVEPSNENVINAFELFDALLVVASVVLWGAIARRLRFSTSAFLIGGTACFINFALMKQMPYYATLTDTSAFVLGMLLMYFYVRESFAGLALTAFVAGFVWPVAVALALPLLLWPRGKLAIARGDKVVIDIGSSVAAAIIAVLAGGFAYTYFYLGIHVVGFGPIPPVVRSLLPISALAFWGLGFFALRALLRGVDLAYVEQLARALTLRRVAVAVTLMVATRGFVALLQKPNSVPILPARIFAGVLAVTPVTRPLIWLVGHVVYFGPWVLLVVLRWRSIARIARREGAALLAFTTGSTILGFLPESRQSILAVPAFAMLLALLDQEAPFGRRIYVVLGVTSIALTKVWLVIGPADIDDLASFRRYFMNHGVYMDGGAYAVQGAAVLIIAASLWFIMRSRAQPEVAREEVDHPLPVSFR